MTVFRGVFISAENSDIYFEIKAELYFYFYAFGDVFRRNGIVLQNRIGGNHFELARFIPRDKNTLLSFPHQKIPTLCFDFLTKKMIGKPPADMRAHPEICAKH